MTFLQVCARVTAGQEFRIKSSPTDPEFVSVGNWLFDGDGILHRVFYNNQKRDLEVAPAGITKKEVAATDWIVVSEIKGEYAQGPIKDEGKREYVRANETDRE